MNLYVSPQAPAIAHAAATAILVLHIAGGAGGIVSGFAAMLSRKGGRAHRVAGSVFVVCMLVMSGIASVVAPMLDEDQWTNTTAAVFTFYLTTTAWMTVRRRAGAVGWFEKAAIAVPLGIAAIGLGLALSPALRSPAEDFATVYVFAIVAGLSAAADLNMIRRGGLVGASRTARHAWRMGAALFVAVGSFFLGQQGFLPEAIRGTFVPVAPVLAAIALSLFGYVRARFPRLGRSMAAGLFVLVAAGVGLAGSDADAAGYRAPKTRFGAPDLQGIWTNSSVTMLQRPPIFKGLAATDAEAAMMEGGFRKMVDALISTAPIDPSAPAPPQIKEVDNADFIEMDMHLATLGGQRRTSWIIDPADGRLPFTDAGRARGKAINVDSYDGPEGRPLTERCLTAIGSPEGPPMMNTAFNAHYQIVQTPDHVAILVEMNHDVRIVRLMDRAHPDPAVTSWLGDSVGWWEGQTLVVETTNLSSKSYVGSLGGGFAHSPKMKITERFTRTARDQMLYEFKVEDPDLFKQPWRAEMPMRSAPGPIYEYACHEGNYSLPNALGGAREEERRARAVPQE